MNSYDPPCSDFKCSHIISPVLGSCSDTLSTVPPLGLCVCCPFHIKGSLPVDSLLVPSLHSDLETRQYLTTSERPSFTTCRNSLDHLYPLLRFLFFFLFIVISQYCIHVLLFVVPVFSPSSLFSKM